MQNETDRSSKGLKGTGSKSFADSIRLLSPPVDRSVSKCAAAIEAAQNWSWGLLLQGENRGIAGKSGLLRALDLGHTTLMDDDLHGTEAHGFDLLFHDVEPRFSGGLGGVLAHGERDGLCGLDFE